eukprot:8854105-Karenia_brevis.AAC.1
MLLQQKLWTAGDMGTSMHRNGGLMMQSGVSMACGVQPMLRMLMLMCFRTQIDDSRSSSSVLPGNGFDVIDAIPLDQCLLSPFIHLDDVPNQHLEAWALAFADVLRAWRDSRDC